MLKYAGKPTRRYLPPFGFLLINKDSGQDVLKAAQAAGVPAIKQVKAAKAETAINESVPPQITNDENSTGSGKSRT
jgi:hypothetical protein